MLGDARHRHAREVLGPPVVPRARVERLRQPPDPVFEGLARFAAEALVAAPQLTLEQHPDVPPTTAFDGWHVPQRLLIGTVSRGELPLPV
ncbi:MAG: hypothetical protein DMD52_00190 [Gemmatimonadetes bacterium]|nr:MAG: hypothetical protein DMD52_00190 [Gemmatimonadota bacterium]